jgi:hypothetical protein
MADALSNLSLQPARFCAATGDATGLSGTCEMLPNYAKIPSSGENYLGEVNLTCLNRE